MADAVNQDRIQRIIGELQEEIPRAGDRARLLQTAVGLLKRTIPPAPRAAPPRKWPPLALTIEMLRTGPDTWVAERLGLNRTTVRERRAVLGIPPFSRGGSVIDRNVAKEQWMDEWGERLALAGWSPPTDQAS
ncbi:MAG: hypothetical protein ACOY93_08550 [Bacillota bacterium]